MSTETTGLTDNLKKSFGAQHNQCQHFHRNVCCFSLSHKTHKCFGSNLSKWSLFIFPCLGDGFDNLRDLQPRWPLSLGFNHSVLLSVLYIPYFLFSHRTFANSIPTVSVLFPLQFSWYLIIMLLVST